MKGTAVLVMLVTLALGCQHNPGPKLKYPGPALLLQGWTVARDEPSRVSIGLPPGWRTGLPRMFEGAQGEMSDMFSATPDVNKAAGDVVGGGAAPTSELERLEQMRKQEGIVLHAVDSTRPTPSEEPTRIYVVKLPSAGFSLLADAVQQEKGRMKGDDPGKEVELPVGKAWRLQAKGRNRIGDVECHVSYVFVDGDDGYVLRLASTNNPEAILSIDAPVAESFRVARN